MSHANHAPLVNRSKLEAEIQCGSHPGACNGLRHTDFLYRSSYHLTPASNRCLVYATLVRTSFGINFRPFLNML